MTKVETTPTKATPADTPTEMAIVCVDAPAALGLGGAALGVATGGVAGAIARILWLVKSAIKTTPDAEKATPKGLLKAALDAGPSAKPPSPEPASVVTSALCGEMYRITLLYRSTMMSPPFASAELPKG